MAWPAAQQSSSTNGVRLGRSAATIFNKHDGLAGSATIMFEHDVMVGCSATIIFNNTIVWCRLANFIISGRELSCLERTSLWTGRCIWLMHDGSGYSVERWDDGTA
jgi:hypothetical protein